METLNWVDEVTITNVVDNVADIILANEGPVRRAKGKKPGAGTNFCADHGVSYLSTSRSEGNTLPVMFDFGRMPLVLLNNLTALEEEGLDLSVISHLILSHPHGDHWGGLQAMLESRRAAFSSQLTLYLGENSFQPRFRRYPDGEVREMGQLDPEKLRAQGVEIQTVREPAVLGGQALLSGEIARVTAFEHGAPYLLVEQDGERVHDSLPGEQALIYKVRDKGLVVVTGCGHAGVVNTLRHAREVTGVEKVFAVIGGFHLNGAPEEVVEQTVAGLAELAPDIMVPMHCTGIPAMESMRRQLPGMVIYNAVGSRYTFAA